ncbi:acyltransferase family protein [Homoserinimonas hongtaonis]|uniref:acyltransferase family protein n=1 Tax=Homoserinimonas hongtaonis TaxID=2079791 RepID=UPI000D36F6AD|nr:acyltransferase family protein [Salinibacterium hongtaonis]AWB89970.1 acetyltransferase [Salinibacterium hongtaonis]
MPLLKISSAPAGVDPTPLRALPSPGGTRFAGLDGLRAIAVVLVLVYHLAPGALVGGFIGVDVFFVISGFLITALLLREHAATSTVRLGRFWIRRARRLLPAIGLLVLVTSAIAAVVGGDVVIGLGGQILGAATFSSNWIALAGTTSYFDASTPELLRNLWSLGVEEQFYLVWPVVLLGLLVVPRRWMRVTLLGATAVAAALLMAAMWSPGIDSTRLYYGTDTHSFGLLAGAAFAVASAGGLAFGRRASIALQAGGMLAIVGLVSLAIVMPADGALPYLGGLALASALSVVAIAGATLDGSRTGAWLDSAPLAWVGERSFGLYLWHWPIWVLVTAIASDLRASTAGQWTIGGIALVLTVAATVASHRYVEQPIRRLGFRGAAREFGDQLRIRAPRRGVRMLVFAVAASASLALIAATASGIVSGEKAGSVERQIEAGRAAIESTAVPHSGATPTSPTSPVASPESAAPAALPGGDQITAIGDSVMLASAASLQQTFPGIVIDAAVSRQFSAVPNLIRAHKEANTLRPIVLLGLGTNGPVDADVLAEVRQLLGTAHQLVVVNVYAPRSWTDGVNTELTRFAQRFRDVELANWRDSIAPQLRLLAGDQIHPGDAGGLVYASAVRDALQRLAELPPVIGPRDYGLAAQPL